MFGDNSCPPPCNTLGFLQKNNSLEEKGRLAGQKNLLSCNNSDRDARFRLTETDFSNLFARGENYPAIIEKNIVHFSNHVSALIRAARYYSHTVYAYWATKN